MIRMPMLNDEFLLWTVSEGGAPLGTGMPAFKGVLTTEADMEDRRLHARRLPFNWRHSPPMIICPRWQADDRIRSGAVSYYFSKVLALGFDAAVATGDAEAQG